MSLFGYRNFEIFFPDIFVVTTSIKGLSSTVLDSSNAGYVNRLNQNATGRSRRFNQVNSRLYASKTQIFVRYNGCFTMEYRLLLLHENVFWVPCSKFTSQQVIMASLMEAFPRGQ